MKKITAILSLTSIFLFIIPLVKNAHTTMDINFYELFEHHRSIMLLINPDTGEIEHANKAAADFYGYTVEQLESMSVFDIHTLAPQKIENEMQSVVNKQKNYFTFEHKLANGDIRTVEVYSCPHTQGDKTILFATVYDVTAKTQLAEKNRKMSNTIMLIMSGMVVLFGLFCFMIFISKRRLEAQNSVIEELNAQLEEENSRYQQQKEILQAIIDSLGAGIIVVDTSARIVFINKAWKDLFNYLDFNQSYLSCECENFNIDDDTCGDIEKFLRKITSGIENNQEIAEHLIKLTRDSESRYDIDLEQTSPVKRFLNLYSNPCISHNEHIFGRVFCVRDVSHQKEVERLKLELISTVSHELRTPMSSILGFSELLLTRKLSEDRKKEYVSIMNSEARRLTDLINDFLDIQRMENGKQVYNMQYNSLDQIISEAARLFQNVGDKHSIVYNKKMRCLPLIYCDKDKMLQVMSNILSNAIKYSPDGGDVIIDLAQKDGKVKVSITDHGLGIPEGVKDKLFTKFYRVDNDDRRKIGGTGLGLAICKEIIRAHRGEIGVESTYGQGSTFYFILPYLTRK